jgi:hypothetical protein
MQNKLLTALVVIDLLLLNVGVGWIGYQTYFEKKSGEKNSAVNVEPVGTISGSGLVGGCGDDCVDKIRAEVEKQIASQASGSGVVANTISPSPTRAVVKTTTTTSKKVRREEILTIPGSGSSQSNDWEDVTSTQFYFDTRDYPGLVEVYFEASIRLVNGNGVGYVRLFDVTNSIAVVGGQNDTSSQADVWTKSQRVNFWSGRNLIRVQAKSLTADTVMYNQGRLRIVTEN